MKLRALIGLLAGLAACGRPPEVQEPVEVEEEGCGEDEVLDEEGRCVPSHCGGSRWGVSSAAAWVDLDAGEGGEGTPEHPFHTIQAGADLAGARGGGLVAVADGTYAETVILGTDHDGVSIAGRCPELTVVDGSGGTADSAAVSLVGTGGESFGLSALAVVGGRKAGVAIAACEATLARLVLRENEGPALAVDAAEVELSDTVIGGDAERAGGLDVAGGAEVWAVGVQVRGSVGFGARVRDPDSHLDLRECSIEAVAGGDAVLGESGALLDVTTANVEGPHEAGIRVTGAGTIARVDHVEIHGGDLGLAVEGGGHLQAVACAVEEARGAGVYVTGEDGDTTTAELYSVHGTFTRPWEDGTGGHGLHAVGDARVTTRGCTMDDNLGPGLRVDGAIVEFTEGSIRRNSLAGAFVSGGALGLESAGVNDTRPDSEGGGAVGVLALDEASVSLVTSQVWRNPGAGLLLVEGSSADLLTSSVRSTSRATEDAVGVGVIAAQGADVYAVGLEISWTEGPGLVSTGGATVSCHHCELEDNTFAGAAAVDGSSLRLLGGTVHNHGEDAVALGGLGVYAVGGELVLDEVTMEDNRHAAVWIEDPGTYLLEDCDLDGGPGLSSHGNSVYATGGTGPWQEGGGGLLLRGNTLRDSRTAVLLDGASATLDDNTFADNRLDLRQQDCAGAELVEGDLTGVNAVLCEETEPVLPGWELPLDVEDYLP